MIAEAAEEIETLVRPGDELARPMQRAVRDLMWGNCGAVRNEEGLRRGLDGLGEIGASLSAVDVSPTEEGWNDLGVLFDLRSALLTGEATIRGALARTESRSAQPL